MQIICKYFPELSKEQLSRLKQLQELYLEWNSKINLISRKDINNFYERHVLHSLSIAKVIHFKKGTNIMDVGTGGGFPGIPLSILFPDSLFYLIDSIGKKILVVKTIADELGLKNVLAKKIRVEEINHSFDFIVSRAVTNLPVFFNLVKNNIHKNGFNELPNGIFYLKGGNIDEELKKLKRKYKIYELSNYFTEDFYKTKKIVYIY